MFLIQITRTVHDETRIYNFQGITSVPGGIKNSLSKRTYKALMAVGGAVMASKLHKTRGERSGSLGAGGGCDTESTVMTSRINFRDSAEPSGIGPERFAFRKSRPRSKFYG